MPTFVSDKGASDIQAKDIADQATVSKSALPSLFAVSQRGVQI